MLDSDGRTRVMPRFIGFDTASLNSVTKAALLCGKELLIPLQFEFFSFQGIVSMMDKIARELDKLDHGLDITGVIPFLVNERRKMSVRYFRSLRKDEALKDIIYPAVHVDGDIPKAQENAQTILEYAPKGRGAREMHDGCQILSEGTEILTITLHSLRKRPKRKRPHLGNQDRRRELQANG